MVGFRIKFGDIYLIDYLGWEKINYYLQKNGYPTTYISYKVVGKRTYPNNAGSCSNL